MNNLEMLNVKEMNSVNGGLLAGALAGAILGGTAGLIGTIGYGMSEGSLNVGMVYRAYVTGALSGAAIGCYTPV